MSFGQTLARSLFFDDDHTYSIGFNSGAYPGNRSVDNQDLLDRIQAVTFLDRCAGKPSISKISFLPFILFFKSSK